LLAGMGGSMLFVDKMHCAVTDAAQYLDTDILLFSLFDNSAGFVSRAAPFI
jgi:hypothetical protein